MQIRSFAGAQACRVKTVAECESLHYYPDFIPQPLSQQLCEELIHSQEWPHNHYEVYGRRFELPRLQTWHADEGIVYSYTNNLLISRPWLPRLLEVRRAVEQFLGYQFNAVLMNYYRHGGDYVGWHTDNDEEMGDEPFIASLSLGIEREFCFRRNDGTLEGSLPLSSGSLLVMKPEFQRDWQHAVLPTKELNQPRINLTFRHLLPPAATNVRIKD